MAITLHSSLASAQVGSVALDSKIGTGIGGFGAALQALDTFGRSLAALGDVDGDGIPDLAVGAARDLDSTGTRPGKVWVLFLDRLGTVTSEVEVTPGTLGSTDQFGWALAAVGDLDGNGVTELAVGANGDDSGGNNRGAVWILFLEQDGSVSSEVKIDSAALALVGGSLANNDEFGSALAPIGDLDGNGFEDLLVGARFDNTGASDAGALRVLFLGSGGALVGQQKIANGIGGLAGGSLALQDAFGSSVAWLGDLDLDGHDDLAVGAPGDDSLASNGGALWHLEIDSAGLVVSQQEITAGAGGLLGIAIGDELGSSVAALGDLGGDGVTELAVGAQRADDGDTNRGALRVLTLTTSGTISASQKISSTAGGFGGPLNGGLFGASVAALGDLDLDGRADLAVGEAAALAPSVGTGTGAVWVLSLVASFDTVWEGDVDSDWFDAANWTNGVPSASKGAVVRDVAVDPILVPDAAAAACLDLVLGKGAFLDLADASEDLTIHRNVRQAGTLVGSGALVLTGAGTLHAATPLNAPVEIASSGTVELIGPGTSFNSDFRLSAGTLLLEAGHTAVYGGFASDFLGGALQGSTATLDLDGPATFAGCDVSAPPTLRIGNDLTLDASFAPASGLALFDGVPGQLVTHIGAGATTFADLDIALGADVDFSTSVFVGGDFDLQGGLAVTGSFEVAGDSVIEGSGDVTQDSRFGGDVVGHKPGAFWHTQGDLFFGGAIIDFDGDWGVGTDSVTFDTPGSVLVKVLQGFDALVCVAVGDTVTFVVESPGDSIHIEGDLVIKSGTVSLALDSELDVDGAGGIEIQALGTLDVGANRVVLPGAPGIAVFGRLVVGADGELALDGSQVSVASGGTLRLVGEDASRRARITSATGVDHGLTIGAGLTTAFLEAQYFALEGMNDSGLVIEPTAILAPFSDGTFDRLRAPFGPPTGVLLDIERSALATLERLTFENSSGSLEFNVRAPGAAVTLHDWSGDFGGPDNEDDLLDDRVFWGAKLVYFTVSERAGFNVAHWRVQRETTELVRYLVERSDDVDPPVFSIPVGSQLALGAGGGAGARSYSLQDNSITPGQAYVYRLREELAPSGALGTLGVFRVDGVLGPEFLPRSPTPPPTPVPLMGGGSTGPGGHAAGAGALGDADELVYTLQPGVHRSFTLDVSRSRVVRVIGEGPGVVIDASAAPLVVRGLRAGQTVELSGLVVDAADASHPAIDLERCEGVVFASNLMLISDGGVGLRARDVRALLLQDSDATRSGGLRLAASLVSVTALQASRLELLDGTRLESRACAGRVVQDSSSTWRDEPSPAVFTEDGAGWRFEAPVGTRWTMLASERFGLERLAGMVQSLFLAPEHTLRITGPRELQSPSVVVNADPGLPRLLQVVYRLPGETAWRTTPVRRTR